MNQKKNNIAIIILAAGSSSRLGRPKQLLELNGKTLLQKSIETYFANYMQPYGYHLSAESYEKASIVLRLKTWLLEILEHHFLQMSGNEKTLKQEMLVTVQKNNKEKTHFRGFYLKAL